MYILCAEHCDAIMLDTLLICKLVQSTGLHADSACTYMNLAIGDRCQKKHILDKSDMSHTETWCRTYISRRLTTKPSKCISLG